MEVFIKVYIKSEDDLPKYGEGELLCQLKSGKIGYYPIGTIRCDYERVDWYLKPVEIPEISDMEIETYFKQWDNLQIKTADKQYKEWLNKYKDELIDSAIIGAKWYREEQRKRMNHA